MLMKFDLHCNFQLRSISVIHIATQGSTAIITELQFVLQHTIETNVKNTTVPEHIDKNTEVAETLNLFCAANQI